jgi:HPt (histidine-containing phosphotransfer) domain-containing protein
MSEAEHKTAALLAALWVKNRPLIEERLAALEAAAAQLPLREETCVEARNAAHKLAGSLGMYGYDEGTRIARELEVMLDGGAVEQGRLVALIAALRDTIFPEG